jgi:flagellar biosynthesis/type III secretory pathway chaperone
MSAEKLITSLEKLIKLHKSLNELAVRKTEVVKVGDMEGLNSLLNDEQKHVKAIELIENEREKQVAEYMKERGYEQDSYTLLECIEVAPKDLKDQLISLREQLIEELFILKNRNQLNQQLIYQSLQFVNVTLDMLRPQQQPINYEKPANMQGQGVKSSKSMFDSKA